MTKPGAIERERSQKKAQGIDVMNHHFHEQEAIQGGEEWLTLDGVETMIGVRH